MNHAKLARETRERLLAGQPTTRRFQALLTICHGVLSLFQS